MKTILIGLCIVGFAIHTNAQNKLAGPFVPIIKEEASRYSAPDVTYANAVYNKDLSAQIRDLEFKVSDYDIHSNPIFSNNYATYEVVFESNVGNIIAIYNDDGKLVNTVEKFEPVKLPEVIRKTLCKEYAGWNLNATSYHVNYCCHKKTRKVYHVQLKQDHKRVNLKIDCEGKILKKGWKKAA